MKTVSFLLLILMGLTGLSGNVLVPRFLARVWFDDADDCFVMFGDEAWWDGFEVSDLCFTTSAGSFYLSPYYTQPSESVFVINLNQEIPGFTIQRNEDFLRLSCTPARYFYPEELRWGPQNDISVHIHPLAPGQSAVRVYAPDYFGHGEYDTGITWAKDSQTISPDPYTPASTYTLNVHLEDINGSPAAGITVYSSYFEYATVYDQYYNDPTNSSGNWERTGNAKRRSILVKDPQTNNTVIQELLFPEPGETIQLNGVVSSVSSNASAQLPHTGVLSLYPSLLTLSSGNTINLKYESSSLLGHKSELHLYDLRGRLLSGKEMPSAGETFWDLPKLGSGIYFITLSEGGRILARNRITVLK